MSDYDPYSPPADIAEAGPAGAAELNTAPTQLMIEHLLMKYSRTIGLSVLGFLCAMVFAAMTGL